MYTIMSSDRPISIMGQIYSSIKEAARDLNADPRALKIRLDSTAPEWEEWRYLNKSQEDFPKNHEIPCSYFITHLPSGAFYVGSSKDGFQRRNHHMWRLKNNINVCKKLQDLWNSDNDEVNWQWTFVLHRSRELATETEQDILTKNRGNPLLLNSVHDARSAISEVMQRDGFREMVRDKLKNLTPEQRIAWGERSRQSALKRWADPEKRNAFLGGNNPTAKSVCIDGVIYSSLKEAAHALNVGPKTIWNRLKKPDKYKNYTFDIPTTSTLSN